MRSRPYLLGLTGSIGMGKSTTARMFAEAGVPVWDADAAVGRLYAPGGLGVPAVATLCPAAAGPGGVDRSVLKAWLAETPGRLERLEATVHPLVAKDRARWLADVTAAGAPIALLDIPLLFETGADADVDATIAVTAAPEVQRARVLARPGMTEAQFLALLSRQLPDAEKRARADHVIETHGFETARAAVARLLSELRERLDA